MEKCTIFSSVCNKERVPTWGFIEKYYINIINNYVYIVTLQLGDWIHRICYIIIYGMTKCIYIRTK